MRLKSLTDNFCGLNVMNLRLEGKGVHNFYVGEKIDTMIKNLERWACKIDESSLMRLVSRTTSWKHTK